MPNGDSYKYVKPAKKKHYYRRKRLPLLIRRFPWFILGFLICLGLVYFVPGFSDWLYDIKDDFAQDILETPSADVVPSVLEEPSVDSPTTKEPPPLETPREGNPVTEVKNRTLNLDEINDLEYNVLFIVNLIRADRGTPLLIWDERLYEYSKIHSINMADKQELSHTPINKPYGENVWRGTHCNWEAMDIVESWMTSPPHRTWLLCPHLKRIAVGIAISNDGDMYASWTFWIAETRDSDWWYCNDTDPPNWWY